MEVLIVSVGTVVGRQKKWIWPYFYSFSKSRARWQILFQQEDLQPLAVAKNLEATKGDYVLKNRSKDFTELKKNKSTE